MDYVIQTDELSFSYSNKKLALDKLSINVPKGSIYGFLGPNGAGKSTTMSLLTGILDDQTSSIELFSKPQKEQFPEVFSMVGSLVEFPALYLHLTGYENLRYIAKIRHKPLTRVDELLKLVNLYEDRNRKVKQYSLGMKQRMAIAMALMGDPDLLLLDEPANGLDPNGIKEVRNLLTKLNQDQGVTVFVSSHILSEIEKMCSHVGIINNGQLKFEGTIDELSQLKSVNHLHISLNDAPSWADKLEQEVEVINNKMIRVEMEKALIPDFVRSIVSQGADIFEIRQQDGLEEWFMEITDND
jgi:ABC-type multidrug transport system ATPase subunit